MLCPAPCWCPAKDMSPLPRLLLLSLGTRLASAWHKEHSVHLSPSLLSSPSYAGLLPVNASSSLPAELFYWLFLAQSGKLDVPLVVWMNGGPGLSSMFGLFNELGPLQLDGHGTPQPRHIHWNDKWHLLFVDQPVGVGFSEYDKASGPLRSLKDTTAQLWEFFQAPESHPDPVPSPCPRLSSSRPLAAGAAARSPRVAEPRHLPGGRVLLRPLLPAARAVHPGREPRHRRGARRAGRRACRRHPPLA